MNINIDYLQFLNENMSQFIAWFKLSTFKPQKILNFKYWVQFDLNKKFIRFFSEVEKSSLGPFNTFYAIIYIFRTFYYHFKKISVLFHKLV